MSDLKPCPFCGATPVLEDSGRVFCPGCGVHNGFHMGVKWQHWNTRTPQEPPADAGEQAYDGNDRRRWEFCPQCGDRLVHANPGDGTTDTYCEECGWPDENRPPSPDDAGEGQDIFKDGTFKVKGAAQPVIHIDATPDDDYPLRILRTYLHEAEACRVESSPPELGEQMNKLQEERAVILRLALSRLSDHDARSDQIVLQQERIARLEGALKKIRRNYANISDSYVYRIADKALSDTTPEPETCRWVEDDPDSGEWVSGCGHHWELVDGEKGGPLEAGFVHCPSCGKRLVEGGGG